MTTSQQGNSSGRLRLLRHRPAVQVLGELNQAGLQTRQWKRTHKRRVILTDTIVVTVAVALAQFGRFGLPADLRTDSAWLSTAIFSLVLTVTWVIALGIQQSWDTALAGSGPDEYRRIVLATGWVLGAISAAALVFQLYPYLARGYLLIAFPAGMAGLIIGRRLLRGSLARKRLQGRCSNQVVVLGQPQSITVLSECFARNKTAGYSIIGACVPGFTGEVGEEINTAGGRVPVLGDEQTVDDVLALTNADALAVTAADHLGHARMRALAWRLDTLNVDMIVVPGMTDVAGPRLKIRPIDNMPLFHIDRARHDRVSQFRKRVFDLFFGSIAFVALIPVMLVAAVGIKLDDGGPIFFRQERVGLGGSRFRIYKFRTMVADSECRKEAEQSAQGKSNVIFYKSESDSRITRIGRLLRQTSIDEIPQIFNVLGGSMSLVGPRPLVPGEGASVEHYVERRSLLKPGVTGLWQVSGRSDVSAEERIRLDHSYVDNWSSIQDFVILWRTVRAVLTRNGAY